MEIFDLRAPTAVDQSDTTDNCPDSMVVAVSFRIKLARKIRNGTLKSFNLNFLCRKFELSKGGSSSCPNFAG